MNDKRDIVSLIDKTKFSKRNSGNTLFLNLKNKDLELNFYSSLDSEVMTKILESLTIINLYDLGQVYIVCSKIDMRKGIDTLAYLVKEKFELDPFSGKVFLFCPW